MAILAFQKPDEVIMVEGSDTKGVFEFRPLEPGFGITIGNALRRILLSSLEGFAITSIHIDGVTHEFASIDGVIEDVADMVLNFKQVRLKQLVPTEVHEKVNFTITGMGHGMKRRKVYPAGRLLISIPYAKLSEVIEALGQMDWELIAMKEDEESKAELKRRMDAWQELNPEFTLGH
jgi:hypothetical protein